MSERPTIRLVRVNGRRVTPIDDHACTCAPDTCAPAATRLPLETRIYLWVLGWCGIILLLVASRGC